MANNPNYIGKNILNHSLEVKNGNIIGDHTQVIKVTVVSDGGNKYAFEGATTPDFTIDEGKTYRFDQSDSTNDGYPFRFSITENGTWGGGSAYSTGVTTHGTPGVKGAYTEINVTKVTPNHLYYYCTAHSGMGNDAVLLKNDFSNLHRVSGSAVSTGSFGKLHINTSQVKRLTEDKIYDYSTSKEDFLFEPKSFEQGIEIQVNNYKISKMEKKEYKVN